MNKTVGIGIVIVLVVLLGGGAWYVMARNKYSSNSSNNSMNMPSTSTSSSSTATSTNSVTIQNFAFSPASITVKKGTTVTWTNRDSVAHTVAETDSKTGPASSDVSPGGTYTFTYNTVGSFQYHCSIHPSMTGTVTVTE